MDPAGLIRDNKPVNKIEKLFNSHELNEYKAAI